MSTNIVNERCGNETYVGKRYSIGTKGYDPSQEIPNRAKSFFLLVMTTI